MTLSSPSLVFIYWLITNIIVYKIIWIQDDFSYEESDEENEDFDFDDDGKSNRLFVVPKSILDLKKASANHLISVGFRSLSKPANGEEQNDSETDKEPSASTTTKRALSEPQTETFFSSNIFRQGNLKSPREWHIKSEFLEIEK